MENWNIKKSLSLYSVNEWGSGYFNINEAGNVCVTPRGAAGPSLDLPKLINDLIDRGLRLPLSIRFPDIMRSRVETLSRCFEQAFESYAYKGKYKGVYPIKVNQERHLVEDIVRFGRNSNLGLEAGSKPELLVALAVMDNPDALIICNGFKDKEYLETALFSLRLGRNTIIVIDRFQELPLLLNLAKNLDIRPRIGLRAKLETKGAGKWVESSGARSKFGLSATEMVDSIEMLKTEGVIDCLELLHFHIGSQITSIRPIKDSLDEACRVYAELCTLGANLKYLDVGGGLGVDYDGSKTNWENSLSYSEQEYANDVVSSIQYVCNENNLPHPDIVTESGRALVAHHCVLVFDVLGTNEVLKVGEPQKPGDNEHENIRELYEIYQKLSPKNMVEFYHDTAKLKDESKTLFTLGYLSLKERASIERLYWFIMGKMKKIATEMHAVPEELDNLDKHIRDAYYCNFSVFQSAPDHWAVRQLFPIMPIHRLKEEPTRRAVLLDLTCDSDGKMDRFIDIKDVKHALEMHPFNPTQPYHIGMFLLGAYQEILGDLHNLFGDTDLAHISILEDGSYEVEHFEQGNTVSDVLQYVDYDRPALIEKMRYTVENALKSKRMTFQEGRRFLRSYEEGLNGYTYLEGDE